MKRAKAVFVVSLVVSILGALGVAAPWIAVFLIAAMGDPGQDINLPLLTGIEVCFIIVLAIGLIMCLSSIPQYAIARKASKLSAAPIEEGGEPVLSKEDGSLPYSKMFTAHFYSNSNLLIQNMVVLALVIVGFAVSCYSGEIPVVVLLSILLGISLVFFLAILFLAPYTYSKQKVVYSLYEDHVTVEVIAKGKNQTSSTKLSIAYGSIAKSIRQNGYAIYRSYILTEKTAKRIDLIVIDDEIKEAIDKRLSI